MNYLLIALIAVPILGAAFLAFWLFSLRRIVPTNLVHTVQRGTATTSYGVGKGSNVYYAFPAWIPRLGVVVRELPVSNFDIELSQYAAYDKDRVPFVVDIKAFFHISDTNKAAEKVESFEELRKQLENVVQGSVRSILAKSKLEEIMEERSVFGERFTENVTVDLQNWGVSTTKNIELMDVRDASGSQVIGQIMAKRMSAIDMESRTEVAKNRKTAEQAELAAQQEIEVTRAETERLSGEAQAKSRQAIGIANAESLKKSGIAEQVSMSEIAMAQKTTAEKDMEVIKVKQIRQAEIDKEAAIIYSDQEKAQLEIKAQGEKFKVETDAAAALDAEIKKAEGVRVIGEAGAAVTLAQGNATAESKKALELASVTAQVTLAKEIGSDIGYQKYLLDVKTIEANMEVGIVQHKSLAEALSKAELKLLINSGDVHSGIGKLSDLFTAKGGSQVNGMIEALKQTEEGETLLGLAKRFAPSLTDKPAPGQSKKA
jgi:flotillin